MSSSVLAFQRDHHVFRASLTQVLILLSSCIIYDSAQKACDLARLPYVCYDDYLRALTYTQNRKALGPSLEGGGKDGGVGAEGTLHT